MHKDEYDVTQTIIIFERLFDNNVNVFLSCFYFEDIAGITFYTDYILIW